VTPTEVLRQRGRTNRTVARHSVTLRQVAEHR
jgi:hypothetical protein